MTLSHEPTYPSRRAYVLKLRSDATPTMLAGRLENMVTGIRREFTSAEGLVASIACDILACNGEEPGGPRVD